MSAVEQGSLPPPESYATPTFVVPGGAWDCHSHVTPRGNWALVSDASYLPAPAPPEKHRKMRAALGLQRGAVIQASVFGTDNTGVIEALTDEPDILRGVVVAGQTIDDAEIERLHGIGVRGMRFITNGLGGTVGTQAMVALAPRIAEFGWHAEVLPGPTQWPELLPVLEALPCKIVIDHMGGFPPEFGVNHPTTQVIRKLLVERGAWVKLIGYRLSDDLMDSRVIERAHAFYGDAPGQMIWGTDWPHVGIKKPVDAGQLLNAFARWFDNDPEVMHRVLAMNPACLFDQYDAN
ncbi:amidohydrolase family protein [Cupriavidus sp. SK-3]|uniref:amidohydrolase family protein n=1 Tax=Cupriavidus sp. SK-3 TaxID=1470558 RepID=UPI0007C7A1DB|nr:amidohydrolase family protein [Cupriavidus sp. SK-3]